MGSIWQLILAWLALVTFATPAAATDLNGRWHIELTWVGPTPPFVELQQVGDTVTIPTIAFYQGSGVPETLTATLSGDIFSSSSFVDLEAEVKDDGNLLYGGLYVDLGPPYGSTCFLSLPRAASVSTAT